MVRTASIIAAAGLLLAACNGGSEAGRRDSAAGDVAVGRKADTGMAGMAGMDHSKMNMGGDSAAAGDSAMAGMDHSKMDMGGKSTGTPRAAGAGGSMAGMDHSKMEMGGGSTRSAAGRSAAAGSMAGMDHSSMGQSTPGDTRGATVRSSSGTMAGMDHANMPGMQHEGMTMPAAQAAPQDPGTAKLQQLVAKLVQDTVVRRRIQMDSVLRNRWQDPDVRRALAARP